MTTVPKQRVSPESPEGLDGFSTSELAWIWKNMDGTEREYIRGYYARIRKYSKLATEALEKRQERMAYLIDYCKANGFTEFNTREKIINDWVFTDANDDWLRWGREVKRCETAINTQLKMSMLLRMDVPGAG